MYASGKTKLEGRGGELGRKIHGKRGEKRRFLGGGAAKYVAFGVFS